MSKKLVNVTAIFGLALVAWVINIAYASVSINKIIYSFVAISVAYFLFKIVLEEVISKRIRESKARYTFKKTTSILFIILSTFLILNIWVIDPAALLVSYGILTAGIAFALQDVLKNFTGG